MAATQPKSLSDLKNPSLLRHHGLINGQWVSAHSSKSTFDVVDPATLSHLATLPEMDAKDAQLAVEAAHAAFKRDDWRKTSARQRARMLRRWSDLCHENAEDLALILTLENGKTLQESRGEVVYGASFLEWFATQAEMTHGENGEFGPTAVGGKRGRLIGGAVDSPDREPEPEDHYDEAAAWRCGVACSMEVCCLQGAVRSIAG